MLRVVEAEAVDGVEVVAAVTVGVVAVHHHHELLCRRPRLLRVDDERAVEALVDVLLQRRRVAVVELHPGRPRLELVGELAAGRDDLEDPVHVSGVDPVEVDRVRMRAGVQELDAEEVALGRADNRPGDGAVVGPGREEDPGRDLDLPVDRRQRVFADPPRLIRQRLGGIGERVEDAGAADRRDALADHRGVTHCRVVVDVPLHVHLGCLCIASEGELPEHRRRDERRGSGEQATARQLGFLHG